jgi:hypothetical protein
MINVAEESVAWTNVAYINSGIATQLRLVYVHHAPGFDDTSRSCVDLIYMVQRTTDGHLDDVHGVRDAWGADMVALLTSRRVSGCGGIAFVGPANAAYMFSVTLQRYSVNGVFAHEVGHNFGCQHDRLNASPGYPYQYGWQDPQRRFRTIMGKERRAVRRRYRRRRIQLSLMRCLSCSFTSRR